MPNWCFNVLKFKNPEIIKDVVKDGKLTYSIILPQPESPEGLSREFLTRDAHTLPDGRFEISDYIEINADKPWFNWYNWNIAFWGCKWDACHSEIPGTLEPSADDGLYHLDFDSPWVAPLGFMEALCRKYPNEEIELDTTYEFEGRSLVRNDKGRMIYIEYD